MTYASARSVDRRELEIILDRVITGEVSLSAFRDWILKVVVAELEVGEQDNDLVWKVVYWLDDCIDKGDGCDLVNLVTTYRTILAAAPANEDAETLLWFAGVRDMLANSLRSVRDRRVSRAEYDAVMDERSQWPAEINQLMKSLPDRSVDDLIAALESEDYRRLALSLQLGRERM